MTKAPRGPFPSNRARSEAGDARATSRALLVGQAYLEHEMSQLQADASAGFRRRRLPPSPAAGGGVSMASVKFDGLPFTVEQLDDAGQRIVETIVAATNGLIPRAAFYEVVVRARPRAYLTLRHGAGVIARSPQAQSVDDICH